TAGVTFFTFIDSSGVHWAIITAGSTAGTSRNLANIFIHPIEMSLHDVEDELRLLRTVRLPRIYHHLRGDAFPLPRMIELVALSGGDANIGFAVQHQRRRRDVLHERDRRVLLEMIELLPRLAAEIIGDESGDI